MRTHGATKTLEYKVWCSMVARCRTQSHHAFKNYGARGITVCERWLSFENFIADMGQCPPGLSLERIDNNRGYEPSNCKWATLSEQMRNTSRTRLFTLNGVTLCQQDWCHRSGLSWGTLNGRLRRGWSFERAITTPAMSTPAKVAACRANGKRYGGRHRKVA